MVNRRTFRFPDLPFELRRSVVQKVDVDQQLLQLKCNKLARSLILLQGPFPGQINQFQLRFSQNSCQLIVQTWYYHEFSIFWESETKSFTTYGPRNGRKLEINDPFRFFRRILKNGCRSLIVTNDSYYGDCSMMKKFLKEEIFTNLQSLANYSPRGKLTSMLPILEEFDPTVSHIYDYRIEIGPDVSLQARENLMRLLSKPTLKDCKIVNIRRPLDECYELLSKSNAQIIMDVNYTKKDEFLSTIQLLVDQGPPINHPKGMIVVRAKYDIFCKIYENGRENAYARNFRELQKLIGSLDGIQKLNDKSSEAKLAYNSFIGTKLSKEDIFFLDEDDKSYDSPYVFDVNYLSKSFYRKEFHDSGRVCVIGLFAEEDRYEYYTEEYLDYCDYEIESDLNFRVRFVMKYV